MRSAEDTVLWHFKDHEVTNSTEGEKKNNLVPYNCRGYTNSYQLSGFRLWQLKNNIRLVHYFVVHAKSDVSIHSQSMTRKMLNESLLDHNGYYAFLLLHPFYFMFYYLCIQTPWRFCGLRVTVRFDISENSSPNLGAAALEGGTSICPDPRMYVPYTPLQPEVRRDSTRTASRVAWSSKCSTNCRTQPAPFLDPPQFQSDQYPTMLSRQLCALLVNAL